METAVLIAVTLAMSGVGMWLIHRLNVQHAARIADYRFGDVERGVGRRHRGHRTTQTFL
ncbi:hypothetical protein ACFWVC_09235 [Streptomyces sp. NPDC058691]|uniref:hypothetical protein n=1 Tax=Streptomyces sp. NPDC058691 TaxID=3346601 RepID=UPI003666EC16